MSTEEGLKISTLSQQVDEKASKSRRHRQKRLPAQTSFERDNEATNQQLQDREQKRKDKKQRRKKKIRSAEAANCFQDPVMASIISGLEEDLHSVEGDSDLVSRVPTPVTPTLPVSHSVGKIYQQKSSGFTKTHPIKLGAQSTTTLASTSTAQCDPGAAQRTALDFAIDLQKAFRSMGVFCHGFLAGLGFWQMLMVQMLFQDDLDIISFIELYSPLAQPFHFMFYFLTVICMISILDRYDIAQISWVQLQNLLTLQSGGIAILVYGVTLILTLVNTTNDDRLSLHRVNTTYLESLDYKELQSTFSTWHALNLCRCSGVILGWFLVSLRPSTDLLHKHLLVLKRFRKAPSDQISLNTRVQPSPATPVITFSRHSESTELPSNAA